MNEIVKVVKVAEEVVKVVKVAKVVKVVKIAKVVKVKVLQNIPGSQLLSGIQTFFPNESNGIKFSTCFFIGTGFRDHFRGT